MKKLKSIIIFLFLYLTCFQSVANAEFHHVDDCYVCHDFSKMFDSWTDPTANEFGIRSVIQTPNSGDREVVFRDRNYLDDNYTDHADGDTLYNGICEVCHTVNNHHRNDGGDNTAHFDGQKCTACHLHENEFAPPLQQAHRTHLDYRGKGPLIQDCTVCHIPPLDLDASYEFSNDTTQSPIFRDGNTLATTNACDNCHSPWGAYPGGVEAEALMLSSTGAKANFRTGIYKSDGFTLKDGKEKWCITCHDDKPSTSHYDADPATTPTPFTIDYRTSAFNWYGYNGGTVWSDRAGASAVAHQRNNGGGPSNNDYMTFDFNVTQTGSYMFSTQWDGDYSTCSVIDGSRPLLISLTDASGTTLKSYTQSGISPEFSEMAIFDVVAGQAQLKVQKDNITCAVNIGPIKIDPQAGSGGTVVIAPMITGDNKTWGYYATGHGVSGVLCTECHDTSKKHIDYDRRTYNMAIGRFNIINQWGDSYRLKTNDPISGASLCARCHDMEMIWVTGGEKSTQTNYRGLANLHSYHMAVANGTSQGGDSDWDGVVDSDSRCISCHNVHGSTKPHMFRDGNLVSTPYTTDKKPMYSHGYEVYTKATWQPVLQGGEYEIFARWPAVAGAATNAPFVIKGSEIFSTTVIVDQTANADTWVSLGTYALSDDNLSRVILHEKETDGTIVADAIRFVSAGETVTVDNTDANYSTLGTVTSVLGSGGFNNNYDTIAAGVTALLDDVLDINTSPTDYGKPLLVEQRNILMGAKGVDIGSWTHLNGICRSCHNSDDENSGTSNENNIIPFTGPKILNRFEEKRWVLNDGTEDAEIYITARDYDSNISSVTLDLAPIGGGVVAMNSMGQQLYHYTIPGSMINGLSDISYELSITVVDTDGQSVTDETYLFPKDGADTIYLDTNDAEVHNINLTRFAIRMDGQSSNGRLPSIDINYFGPGYRFSAVEAELANMYGIWRPEIPTSGRYEVYGFWDDLTGATLGVFSNIWTLPTGAVKYTVYASDGTHEIIKDQTVGGGGWNYIGTFSFLDDESNYVRQETSSNITMIFDAMKFVRVNSSPLVRLSASQLGKKTRIIAKTTDRVILSAIGSDYDSDDTVRTLTYDWSANSAEILDNGFVVDDGFYGEKFSFDSSSLSVGFHEVQVTVTDSHGASTTVKLALQVLDSYPVLTAVDTDGDGINDDVEGFTDFDEDGLPNYLDADNTFNQIPAGSLNIVTQEGLEIRIGSTALAVDSNDSVITTLELNTSGTGGENGLFDGAINIGGIFDFDIIGLQAVGQTVKVVLPLQDNANITAGATYQKYDENTGWKAFVEDINNALHSASSVAGICPIPDSVSYAAGLNVGDDCIQVTIQDGGPNDADGLVNAEVKDPGGIFGVLTSETQEEDKAIVESITYTPKSSGGSGSFTLYSLLILGLFGIVGALARQRGA